MYVCILWLEYTRNNIKKAVKGTCFSPCVSCVCRFFLYFFLFFLTESDFANK